MADLEKLTFTLDEVETATGFSAISLRRGCKAGRYKHEFFGGKYRMTRAQIDALLAAHERGGDGEPLDEIEDDDVEAARQATAARVTRRGAA